MKRSKFKIGQVAMIVRGARAIAPIYIQSIDVTGKGDREACFRCIGNGFYEWEANMRPLTKREVGIRLTADEKRKGARKP
jgi:hypothetical protein